LLPSLCDDFRHPRHRTRQACGGQRRCRRRGQKKGLGRGFREKESRGCQKERQAGRAAGWRAGGEGPEVPEWGAPARPLDIAGGWFDLICNAQRRVSTRPSHAPASSRHVECTCSLIPIIPKPSRRGPTRHFPRPQRAVASAAPARYRPPPTPPHPPNHPSWWLESVDKPANFYGRYRPCTCMTQRARWKEQPNPNVRAGRKPPHAPSHAAAGHELCDWLACGRRTWGENGRRVVGSCVQCVCEA
jgi:hypothetical protein